MDLKETCGERGETHLGDLRKSILEEKRSGRSHSLPNCLLTKFLQNFFHGHIIGQGANFGMEIRGGTMEKYKHAMYQSKEEKFTILKCLARCQRCAGSTKH